MYPRTQKATETRLSCMSNLHTFMHHTGGNQFRQGFFLPDELFDFRIETARRPDEFRDLAIPHVIHDHNFQVHILGF